MKKFWRRLTGAPFISIGLVCVNVVIYIVNHLSGQQLIWLGNLNVYDVLRNGEYGRIVWAMFLHADVNHLFNNMFILLFMGAMLEKESGHFTFCGIYMLSGICGNICSLIYKLQQNSISMSIGASGAVFGMDGLLLSLVFFSMRKISAVTPGRVVIMIVLSLYNGFAGNRIDNAAHVGGLSAGFLLGCLLCIGQRVKYNINEKRYNKW